MYILHYPTELRFACYLSLKLVNSKVDNKRKFYQQLIFSVSSTKRTAALVVSCQTESTNKIENKRD